MHIPDGYLGPQTYVVLDVVMVPIWVVAAKKVKRNLKTRQIPLLALGAAFSFIIMMFNVPVIGGSTGHAVGAALIAILLGPWAAVIAVSIALVIQAGLFGDGGITTIGANCFNMAVVAPFVGYYLYRLAAGDRPAAGRRVAAAGIAGYVSLVVAAIVTGIEFGIQPYLAHTASGQALYAPYKLAVAVPAMAAEHLVFFGPVEAIVTMGVVAALARSDPELLLMRPAARPLRWLWAGLAALILLTPLGALASGTAWGEWSGPRLRELVGYVPGGHGGLSGLWHARLAGYSVPGVHSTFLGYLMAAVAGAALAVGVALVVGRLIAGPRGDDAVDDGGRPGQRRHGARSLARKGANGVARAVGEVLQNEDLAARSGLLQRLDPRAKLLTLVLFAVLTSLVQALWVLLALYALTLVLAAASCVGVGSFARKVWGSAGVLTVLLVLPSTLAWFTPGAVAFSVGPLTFTEPGLLGALTLVTRVVAAAGFALLIVWTMRWTDVLRALTALRLPDVVVATLAMTQKQVLTLLRTVEQVHLARESRTLGDVGARADRAWVTGRIAFVARKSMHTADDVYDAMLARGFTGAMPSLVRLRLAPADWLWAASCAALCAAALAADRLVR